MSIIPASVTQKLGVATLKLKSKSPALLFAGGVAGMIGTAVLASQATLKLDDILTETNDKLKQIAELQHEDYSEQDRLRDGAIVRTQLVLKIGKLYGPAILLGVASIGMLAGSNHILTKRNAAITAAYAAVEKGFREYRERVVKDLGVDKDLHYYHGIEKQTVTEVDEDGKKTSVEKSVATTVSPYGRLFNEFSSTQFQHVPEYNILFLRGIQSMANDRLKSKGYVFLNDIYDDLGLERTQAGCVVGWLLNGDGDGYIDFGIFGDDDTLRIHDFLVGRENEIFLDFNVDGVIYDKF